MRAISGNLYASNSTRADQLCNLSSTRWLMRNHSFLNLLMSNARACQSADKPLGTSIYTGVFIQPKEVTTSVREQVEPDQLIIVWQHVAMTQ